VPREFVRFVEGAGTSYSAPTQRRSFPASRGFRRVHRLLPGFGAHGCLRAASVEQERFSACSRPRLREIALQIAGPGFVVHSSTTGYAFRPAVMASSLPSSTAATWQWSDRPSLRKNGARSRGPLHFGLRPGRDGRFSFSARRALFRLQDRVGGRSIDDVGPFGVPGARGNKRPRPRIFICLQRFRVIGRPLVGQLRAGNRVKG